MLRPETLARRYGAKKNVFLRAASAAILRWLYHSRKVESARPLESGGWFSADQRRCFARIAGASFNPARSGVLVLDHWQALLEILFAQLRPGFDPQARLVVLVGFTGCQ